MYLLQLKKIFRTYKSLVITIVILLLSIAGFIFGVIPLVQKAMNLSQDVFSLSADVASLGRKTSLLDSLDEQTLRNELMTLTSAVPPDKSFMTILATIDTVTSKTGVTVVDLSLTQPGSLATESAKKLTVKEAAVGSNIIPLTLSVRGTYDQIHMFLATIISVRRFFQVRSLTASFETNTGVTAHIAMDAFYYPLPSVVGSVSQNIVALTEKEEQTIRKVASMQLASMQSLFPEQTSVFPSAPIGKIDPFSQ